MLKKWGKDTAALGRIVLSMLLVPGLGGCGQDVGPGPTSRPSVSTAPVRNLKLVGEVHKTEEWRRIVNALKKARSYYGRRHTWRNPFKQSEMRRVEGDLAAARDDARTLVRMGGLSEPEAALLQLELEELPKSYSFRSRNVVYDEPGPYFDAEVHRDGVPASPGTRSWHAIVPRMPTLEKLSRVKDLNGEVVGEVLRPMARHMRNMCGVVYVAGGSIGIRRISPKEIEEVADRAKKLIDQIRENVVRPPGQSNSE